MTDLQPVAPDTYPRLPGTDDTDWLACAQHVATLALADRHIGRPTVLSDVYRVHQFLKHCAAGNYPHIAAQAAGFAKSSYYNWVNDAKTGNSAAIALMDYVEKGCAEDECETNADIKKAQKSPQFWAAGMTRQERRYPDRWGRRTDDSSVPKVVVQIGVLASDVKVNVVSVQGGPSPTSLPPFDAEP